MLQKIELDENGIVFHVYKIFGNKGENIIDHTPNMGLVIDFDQDPDQMFDKFINNLDLTRRIYEYKNGAFQKRNRSIVELDIADWVDKTPIELPKDYNKNEYGLQKANPKKIEDLTPEELNEIVEPIPTIDDFSEIQPGFVKKDLYKEHHQIDF